MKILLKEEFTEKLLKKVASSYEEDKQNQKRGEKAMEKIFKRLVREEVEKQIKELRGEIKELKAIITSEIGGSKVIEMRKLSLRAKLLSGEEVELQPRSLEEEVYYELIEEVKEVAKDLFRDVATTNYMDTRYELEELDSIMLDHGDYEVFYTEIIDFGTKVDLEDEIMEELAEELESNLDCVIGYDYDKPVMIMSKNYYRTEIKDNEDNLDDYEGIRFVGAVIKDSEEVKKDILAGKVKTINSEMENEVYSMLLWELAEEVKELFKNVASTHYIDIRKNGFQIANMMVNLKEYEELYKLVENCGHEVELEMEIMQLLAEELEDNPDFIVGYKWGKAVMIMCRNYFVNEIRGNEDNFDDYVDIRFIETLTEDSEEWLDSIVPCRCK